ncbi:MAG: hypothetical protein HOM58_12255 [Rhodospirillaceae bacterium]|jgi:LPS-assembly lipoprotein|nr:hypothetical protein [Rhodospirillaceae bacterium]MBT5458197.1 hypothetical protein [Rhodospirillaceae bacterium]
MWFIPDLRRSAAIGVLACITVAAAGCGFSPLYGKAGGSDAAVLSTIQIKQIPDRVGQTLRNFLLERLAPKGQARRTAYTLSVKLTESKRVLAIRKDETATRANLVMTADFSLTADHAPRRGTITGVAVSTNSYNVLRSDFATLSAEKDARDRALRTIADEIRLQVAAALRNPQAFTPTRKAPPQPNRRRAP